MDLKKPEIAMIDYNLSIRNKILDVCKPLFDNFGITYFEFDQICNDGRVFYISTDKKWLQFSLENRMFHDEDHVNLCSIAKTRKYRYALWDKLKLGDAPLLSNYFHHDIWNGLTINEIEENSFNTYSFATTKNNTSLNSFFINNLPLFDHFIFYFKQKLKLILDEENKKLFFNATPLKDIKGLNEFEYDKNAIDFIEKTSLQHFEINLNDKIICLTRRELQCLQMLSSGKTSKEIGNQLAISRRTVEGYINSVKNKTGLTFKNELISFFEKSPLKLYKENHILYS